MNSCREKVQLSRISEETEGRNVYVPHVTVKQVQFECTYLNRLVYEIYQASSGNNTCATHFPIWYIIPTAQG